MRRRLLTRPRTNCRWYTDQVLLNRLGRVWVVHLHLVPMRGPDVRPRAGAGVDGGAGGARQHWQILPCKLHEFGNRRSDNSESADLGRRDNESQRKLDRPGDEAG